MNCKERDDRYEEEEESEDEYLKEERERERDLKERDEFAERLKQKDLEKTKKVYKCFNYFLQFIIIIMNILFSYHFLFLNFYISYVIFENFIIILTTLKFIYSNIYI